MSFAAAARQQEQLLLEATATQTPTQAPAAPPLEATPAKAGVKQQPQTAAEPKGSVGTPDFAQGFAGEPLAK